MPLSIAEIVGVTGIQAVREAIQLNTRVVEVKTIVPPFAHPRPVLPSRVAVIGNYLPRKCGIATFTTDLCDALHAEFQTVELLALPVNDIEEGYSYPARVRFELYEDNWVPIAKQRIFSISATST